MKKLYPQTDKEWQEYCKEAKRILIQNSLNRENDKENRENSKESDKKE